VICDPLGGGGTTGNNKNGLQAQLTYLPQTSSEIQAYLNNSPQPALTTTMFAPTAHDVVTSKTPIILNQLNVTTRSFDQGFQNGSGATITDTQGNLLTEYFSLRIDSNIMLNQGDPEGNYQLAVISDDGSIVYLMPGIPAVSTSWINSDKQHSAMLDCASNTIALKQNLPVPLHVDYFQGPKVRLGLILLWRLDPHSLTYSECGTARGDDYIFKQVGTDPSKAQTPFLQLLADGWAVIPAANYYLQTGTNTCPK
jgi:hypothetical protein